MIKIMVTQHTMHKGVTYLDISQPITTNTSDREVGPNNHTNILVKSTHTKNPVYTTENSVEGKTLMQNVVYQTITGKSVKIFKNFVNYLSIFSVSQCIYT